MTKYIEIVPCDNTIICTESSGVESHLRDIKVCVQFILSNLI